MPISSLAIKTQGGVIMTKEFALKLIEKLDRLVADELVKDGVDNERGHLNINLSFIEIGAIIGALQVFVDDYKE